MTRFLRLAFCLVCTTVLTLNALAQSRWKAAATGANGQQFYIGESLSRQADGSVLGWERSDLPPNKSYPVEAYFVTRSEWNCRESKSRHLGAFIYDRDGEFLEKLPVDTAWRYDPPDSIGEFMLTAACRAAPPEKNPVAASVAAKKSTVRRSALTHRNPAAANKKRARRKKGRMP